MLLAHMADTHVGMTNVGNINPATGLHSRLEDFDQSLGEAVAVCLSREVDAFVFAGDAYKHASPTPTYRHIFEQRMKELIDHGIPIVMIVGNHDTTGAYGAASALQSFETLAGVHVIDTPKNITLRTRSGQLLVSCMPWPTRRMLLDVKTDYQRLPHEEVLQELQEYIVKALHTLDEDAATQTPVNKILLAHLDVDDAKYSSEQTMLIKNNIIVPREELSSLQAYGYIGLGHIHMHQHLETQGDTPIVYCGSIDRIDFSEEHDAKGFCLVTLEENVCTACEFVELGTRAMQTITADLDDTDDPTSQLLDIVRQRTCKDAIVRIFYTLSEGKTIDVNRVHAVLQEEGVSYVQGIVHLSEAHQHETLDLTEHIPIKLIEEYIDHRESLRDHKHDIMELVNTYLGVEN